MPNPKYLWRQHFEANIEATFDKESRNGESKQQKTGVQMVGSDGTVFRPLLWLKGTGVVNIWQDTR